MTAICTIDGCSDPLLGRGWCRRHYSRWRRHGDPLGTAQPKSYPCAVPDCTRTLARQRRDSRGLCSLHKQRLCRAGRLELADRPDLAGRLWSRVNREGPVPAYRPDLGPCWLWTGRPNPKGYGFISLGGRRGPKAYVHRLAYELLVGPIPAGLHIDHLCRVPACLRPTHLEPVTPAENNARALAAKQKEAA